MTKKIYIPVDALFQPTCDKAGEIKKAYYKNLNLSVLQHIYMGDPTRQLTCLLTGEPGWVAVPDLVTGEPKMRFRLDFNHIRQRNKFLLGLTRVKSPGTSVDKVRDPSSIIRACDLSLTANRMRLMEMICCIPLTLERHKYVTQDSSLNHISLAYYPAHSWPWVLQSRENFEAVQQQYWGSTLVDYDQLITMLMDPLAEPYYTQFQL